MTSESRGGGRAGIYRVGQSRIGKVMSDTHPAPQRGPELFIGLVGAVGTDLDQVTNSLGMALSNFGYAFTLIRLSDFLKEIFRELRTFRPDSEFLRIDKLMTYGDRLRKKLGRPDALAVLACGKMMYLRAKATKRLGCIPRNAFVLHSLKRPEEVLTLREVYGPAFHLVAAYCPRDLRVSRLSERIAGSKSKAKAEEFRDKAERLVNRDRAEEEEKFGQNLGETFPLADVFVNASDPDKLGAEVSRFVSLVFGHQFLTPTRDEFGMFHAKAAALRSSDLSRQVGAAIASDEGQIIAVGTNEVPKFGGGLYWHDDVGDARDFKRLRNPNREARTAIISEILDRMKTKGWLKESLSNRDVDELATNALSLLAETRVMDISEFGRSVHAEMAALVDAAFRGVSVKDGTLYTTTFPCHMCAKHIVAAGIKRVVYVEPYPKSLAAQMHEDSIAVDHQGHIEGKVSFEAFIGIAPRRYIDMFTAPRRQGPDGRPAAMPLADAEPRTAVGFKAYESTEKQYVQGLTEGLGKFGRRLKRPLRRTR
jgi:cytidine deaminase